MYKLSAAEEVLERDVPFRTDVFQKAAQVADKKGIGQHPAGVWAIEQWRRTTASEFYSPHPRMQAELLYQARLTYEHSRQPVSDWLLAWLPMSPALKNFVRVADIRRVGREALLLVIPGTRCGVFCPSIGRSRLDIAAMAGCGRRPIPSRPRQHAS